MYKLLSDLFPFNRSITGEGVRQTINRISAEIPLKVSTFESGLNVFDWTVPHEWNVKSAKIYDPDDRVVVDFETNNLYLMSYSIAIDTVLSLDQLLKHIVTDATRPDWIPYSTSYYNDHWAFCLPYNFVKKMLKGEYRVVIDSTKQPGSLNYAEAFIDSGSEKEVLISSYICHPSMANDSLSGVVLAVQLYKELIKVDNLKYNYRFLFAPETIGTICFLYKNRETIKSNLEYGLVATCVGDSGQFTYKETKNEKSKINRVVENIFNEKELNGKIVKFSPLGSDERQYCSPGFDLDVGALTRSIYGSFPEYHTSADDLSFVSQDNLNESLAVYLKVIMTYELNCKFLRSNPFCEPQLGKYNLYRTVGGGGEDNLEVKLQQRMWLLNYADAKTDLLTISEKSGFSALELAVTSLELIEAGLITKALK